MSLYQGIRDCTFKNLISNTLKLGNLKLKYIEILTNESSLKLYDQAFTHHSYDPLNNYEYLEFLGDSTINKSIVWYLSRRYPELNKKSGVQILARLKINMVSKQRFSEIADSLNFWDFISCDNDMRLTQKKSLLEDTLESFIGVTEKLIDDLFRRGSGYDIVYNIIETLFNRTNIYLIIMVHVFES
jgi:dsRNA-specific ribonuclease